MFYTYSIINENPKAFAHGGEKQKAKVTMAIAIFFLFTCSPLPEDHAAARAREEEGCRQGAALALGTDLRKIILPAGMESLTHICYTMPDGLHVGRGVSAALWNGA